MRSRLSSSCFCLNSIWRAGSRCCRLQPEQALKCAQAGAALMRGHAQYQKQDERDGSEVAADNNHQPHIKGHEWKIGQYEA